MDPNPPVESPAESETRPSHLATMSLVLAIVPFILVGQLMVGQPNFLPGWVHDFLQHTEDMSVLVLLVSPVISIVCGIVALVQMIHDPSLRGRWKVWTGITLVVIFISAAFIMPLIGGGPPKRHPPNCISNLKAISVAITMYADDYENQMPATLEELANDTYLPTGSTYYQCPMSHKPYHYPGASRIWRTNMNEISVYCGTNHLDNTHALYNDGRVGRTNSAAVKASVAAMQSTNAPAPQETTDKPAK